MKIFRSVINALAYDLADEKLQKGKDKCVKIK